MFLPHFYPTAIHEKIFIVFMVSSQVHMLIVLKLLKMADFGREQQSEQRSYFFKRCLFYLSLLCTFGLLVFFVKHRVYCHDMGNSTNTINAIALGPELSFDGLLITNSFFFRSI
jgi:hypothetical protein